MKLIPEKYLFIYDEIVHGVHKILRSICKRRKKRK